jgi:hypothetical protein
MRRRVVARRDFWRRVSRREKRTGLISCLFAAGWSGGDEGIALMWVG